MENFFGIQTKYELSKFLNIPLKKLTYLLYVKHIEDMYTSFLIPKKHGGFRNIDAPNDELKSLQRTIAHKLYYYYQECLIQQNIISNQEMPF